jgi:PPOX class probable F420-dependent enzyme
VINTGDTSVKGRNIRRDPRVALCVDDDRPPFAFVTIEGIAAISEDPDELLHWSTVIGGRYMGSDQAQAFGARNAVPGELVVRLRPTHIVASAGITD